MTTAVFTWEGPVGGKAKSVGAQRSMAQLTLFDVTFEKNLERSEPGELKPTEDLFPVQTTLHAFLKMPESSTRAGGRRIASAADSSASDDSVLE